jgi:hypothetical protein
MQLLKVANRELFRLDNLRKPWCAPSRGRAVPGSGRLPRQPGLHRRGDEYPDRHPLPAGPDRQGQARGQRGSDRRSLQGLSRREERDLLPEDQGGGGQAEARSGSPAALRLLAADAVVTLRNDDAAQEFASCLLYLGRRICRRQFPCAGSVDKEHHSVMINALTEQLSAALAEFSSTTRLYELTIGDGASGQPCWSRPSRPRMRSTRSASATSSPCRPALISIPHPCWASPPAWR